MAEREQNITPRQPNTNGGWGVIIAIWILTAVVWAGVWYWHKTHFHSPNDPLIGTMRTAPVIAPPAGALPLA